MHAWVRRFAVVLGFIGGFALTDGASAGPSIVDDATAVNTSLAYLQARAADWGILKAHDEFRLHRVVRDSLGQTHVRLDQVSQGLPVFGHQLIVHLDQSGAPRSVTGTYLAGITASPRPTVSGQQARAVARGQFPGPLTETPQVELLWYPVSGGVRLAYRVVLSDDETPRRVVAFVDAVTGILVHSFNDLRTVAPSPAWPPASGGGLGTPAQEDSPAARAPAIGVGHSLYVGTVSITTELGPSEYTMADGTRGNLSTVNMNNRRFGHGTIFSDADNTWGDGTTGDPASAAVDAHLGAEMTWDYYLVVHGRDGIGDDGVGALSRVHYKHSYNNAFWSDSCKCMTYGDGDGTTFSPLTALDVAGHEMTHGVTSTTAGLIYDNQSGGLNEATSDIFGTMVEFYSAAHVVKTPNYLIGEDIFTPGTPGDALRYMNNPTQDGHSIDTFADYTDQLDVHYTSGIANNAYFLLAEGGTHRLGGVVTGIGRSAAERIFYRALTVYMVPSETFSQARAHTTQAAIDLFESGSQEVLSVGQAWSAVGVN